MALAFPVLVSGSPNGTVLSEAQKGLSHNQEAAFFIFVDLWKLINNRIQKKTDLLLK
jgi:hypothetical protein